MPVHCAYCGEELLGSVNRCWKCGQGAISQPGPSDLPPIRRPPITGPLDVAPMQAGLAIEAILVDSPADDQPEQQSGATAVAPVESLAEAKQPRRGSPFANGAPSTKGPLSLGARPANYRRNSAATGGAISALLLAILSLIGAFVIPIGGLLTALLGLGMGVWGLYSERRNVAIFALLLCCIGLAVSSFYCAIELYTFINGYSPWEAPTF